MNLNDFYLSFKDKKNIQKWLETFDKPLFISGNKGLYPIFKTGGPTGAFPKNHQEFELKDIKEDNKDDEFSGL